MLTKLLRKLLVLVMVFAFELANISTTFAAKKKAARRSLKKSAGKKKAGGSSRRSAGSRRRSAGKSSSRRSARGGRRTAMGAAGRGTSLGTTANDGKGSSDVDEKVLGKCKAAYVTCMDLQISGLISKYSYISSDPSIEAMVETGDPVRCVYYHNKATGQDFDGSKEKDINNLFFGYNYYCSPEPTIENGRPVNKCRYSNARKDQSAVFASPNSYAYYKEANKRMEAGELKVINFTQTDLWKNKISKVFDTEKEREEFKGYQVEASDVSDLMKGLGISNEATGDEKDKKKVQLFSISVAPPPNSGSFSPSGAYNRAHNICIGELDLPTEKESGLTKAVIDKELKAAIGRLKTSSCQDEDFSSFYVNGNDEEESFKAFLSAKKSCEKYENALISVRNNMYAKFQDGFTNYLQDNLAKIIKRNSKDTTTIANALNNVVTSHTKNVTDRKMAKAKAKISEKQTDREINKIDREEELAKKQQIEDIKRKELEILKIKGKNIETQAEVGQTLRKARAKLADQNAPAILALCNETIDAAPLNRSFFSIAEKMKVCLWGAAGDNLKMVTDPECQKNKTDEFYNEVACSQIKGFDLTSKIMSKIDQSKFATLHTNVTAGILPQGIYRVTVAGGAGGRGGNSYTCKGQSDAQGGSGGGGDRKVVFEILPKSSNFKSVIGHKGSDGNDAGRYNWGGRGAGGGTSSFTVNGKTISAAGGGGGGGAYARCLYSASTNGDNGASAGNGQNLGNGYVVIDQYTF